MKKFAKLMALVLALVLVFSLAACSKQAGIAGAWKYTMDLKELTEKSIASEAANSADSGMTEEQIQAMGESMGKIFDGINMITVLELREDNSFTLSMDEASVKAAAETLSAKLPDLMPELLAAMFGQTVEELEESLKEWDMSLEDMTESMKDELSADSLLEDMELDTVTGTYRYEEGKLYLTPKAEEGEEAQEITLTVELAAKELKITALDGEVEDADMYKAILPIVFTR